MAKANEEIELMPPVQLTDGEGIIDLERTSSLVEYLEQLRRKRAYEKLLALRGKIKLNIDIDELRGRNR
jgi:hypothetical protein